MGRNYISTPSGRNDDLVRRTSVNNYFFLFFFFSCGFTTSILAQFIIINYLIVSIIKKLSNIIHILIITFQIEKNKLPFSDIYKEKKENRKSFLFERFIYWLLIGYQYYTVATSILTDSLSQIISRMKWHKNKML